jgi:hypothetical protein
MGEPALRSREGPPGIAQRPWTLLASPPGSLKPPKEQDLGSQALPGRQHRRVRRNGGVDPARGASPLPMVRAAWGPVKIDD